MLSRQGLALELLLDIGVVVYLGVQTYRMYRQVCAPSWLWRVKFRRLGSCYGC